MNLLRSFFALFAVRADDWLLRLWAASWQGALLIVFVGALCRFFPRLPAVRCALWWLACARLLVGLIWATPVIHIPLLPAPARHSWGTTGRVVPAEQSQALSRGLMPVLFTGEKGKEPTADAASSPPDSSGSDPIATEAPITIAAVLLALWFGAAVAALGTGIARLLLVRRVAGQALPPDPQKDAGLLLAVEVASASLGIKRIPRLLLTEADTDPLTVGLFRPVVLLSRGDIAHLSPEELRLVLSHEFAHLRRGDLWLGLTPQVAQCLFLFHPLAWLACREFSLAREEACDAEALRVTRLSPADYGRLLIRLGARNPLTGSLPANAIGVTSHFRTLERRIRMIQQNRPAGRRLATIGSALLIGVAAVGLVPWTLTGRADAQAPSKSAADGDGPADLVNDGSGDDWSRFPTAPRNLDFSDGLKGWVVDQAVAEGQGFQKLHDFRAGGTTEGGVHAAFLEVTNPDSQAMAFIRQGFRPNGLRGKKIRIRMNVRTEGKQALAMLWIRLDAVDFQRNWSGQAVLRGEHKNWTPLEYVLEVPPETQGIYFGIGMPGTKGRVLIKDALVEAVDTSTKVTLPIWSSRPGDATATPGPDITSLPAHPANLDFSKGIQGWEKTQGDGSSAEGVLEASLTGEKRGEQPVLALTATKADKEQARFLTQTFRMEDYRGKRVRFVGDFRAEKLEGFGGLWLRIDGNDFQKAWNAKGGVLRGTTDWKEVGYVFDVPATSKDVQIGLNLFGKGTLAVSNLRFEPVTPSTEVNAPDYDSDRRRGSGAAKENAELDRLLGKVTEISWRGEWDEDIRLAKQVHDDPRASDAQKAAADCLMVEAYYYKGDQTAMKAAAKRFFEEYQRAPKGSVGEDDVRLVGAYRNAPDLSHENPAELLDASRQSIDAGGTGDGLHIAATVRDRSGVSSALRCRAMLLVSYAATLEDLHDTATRMREEFARTVATLSEADRKRLQQEQKEIEKLLKAKHKAG